MYYHVYTTSAEMPIHRAADPAEIFDSLFGALHEGLYREDDRLSFSSQDASEAIMYVFRNHHIIDAEKIPGENIRISGAYVIEDDGEFFGRIIAESILDMQSLQHKIA